MSRPIVTLLTDFGQSDTYVAQMKGVILGIAPFVQIVDVTHQIPPQEIRAAARGLVSILPAFPQGTIHACVVDPGVGSERRFLLATIDGQRVIAPDNGLLTLAIEQGKEVEIREMTETWFRRFPCSATFHGRDLVAPAVGHLAKGVSAERFGPVVQRPHVLLSFSKPVLTGNRLRGEVTGIDHFGNLLTNISRVDWERDESRSVLVSIGGRVLGPLRQFYSQVGEGELLALVSSQGVLEIACRNGNAAGLLGGYCGMEVELLLSSG